MKTITSRHNAIVKRYRQVARREADDLILLDGVHLLTEAVRAGVPVACVVWSARARATADAKRLLGRLQAQGAETWEASEPVIGAISPVKSASGVVALAHRPAWTLARALERRPQLVVAAVDVQDAGNVGAIVRSAEAGGATAAVFCGASADPFGWKALRGSMGSALRLPVVAAQASELLTQSRGAGVRVLATVPRGGTPMFDVDLTRPVALLLGGEGPGLPEDITRAADEKITIPMGGPVESLNVAVAAALLVYEASRQRGAFS